MSRRLSRAGWVVRHEVPIGRPRPIGWIDVLAFHRDTRALFIAEVKSDLPDIGGAQRQVGAYAREARFSASGFGWRPERQAVALLGLATATLDRRIMDNRLVLRASFPGRASALLDWLDDPSGRPPQPALALIDPASRRQRWLQSPTVDGRRSPLPYVDYRDFITRIRP